MKLAFVFSIIIILSGLVNANHDYLKVKGHQVESTHQARFKLKVDKSYKLLGEFHHQPTYAEKQFNVSLAAFAKNDAVVLIHAETHTDGSGGLDYSKLTPVVFGDIKFTSREQCATPSDIPDPYSNPELRFVRDSGYNIALPMYLKQYFVTSSDGRAEIVLTYGKRVASCGDETITSAFKEQADREMRAAVKIKKKK